MLRRLVLFHSTRSPASLFRWLRGGGDLGMTTAEYAIGTLAACPQHTSRSRVGQQPRAVASSTRTCSVSGNTITVSCPRRDHGLGSGVSPRGTAVGAHASFHHVVILACPTRRTT